MRAPGRERSPDDIPNLVEYAKEDPLMTEDGYDLISYGADGIEGGEGEDEDIVNWKVEEEE